MKKGRNVLVLGKQRACFRSAYWKISCKEIFTLAELLRSIVARNL